MNDNLTPPQSLGPAQPARPLADIVLADTGSNVGAVVALVFCGVALAVLLLPLSRALRSYDKERNRKG